MRLASFTRLITTFAILGVFSTATSALAQGYPGGGGGRPGSGGGPRPAGGRAPAPGTNMAKRFEEMSSLKRALKGVKGLSKAQKDSLKRIEATYKERFRGYGNAVKKLTESAAAAGTPSNIEEMRKLRDGAETLQQRQFAEARAVLSTDEQRAVFDANVATIREGEAERREKP